MILKSAERKEKLTIFEIEQNFSIYQNPPKRPRQKLDQKLEDILQKEKIFKCDICSKTYNTNGALNCHFSSIHNGKTFKCHIFPSTFTQKSSMKMHIQ